MKSSDIIQAFMEAFNTKRIEPEQRLVGGRFGWAFHRFPIKGGISLTTVHAENMTRPNPLFERLKRASPSADPAAE